MTPEAKANNLIEKFKPHCKENHMEFFQHEFAKLSAIICVKECMKISKTKKNTDYWKKVKTEIRKL